MAPPTTPTHTRLEGVRTRTYSRPGSSPESSISPTFSADAASYSTCTAHAVWDTTAPVACARPVPLRPIPLSSNVHRSVPLSANGARQARPRTLRARRRIGAAAARTCLHPRRIHTHAYTRMHARTHTHTHTHTPAVRLEAGAANRRMLSGAQSSAVMRAVMHSAHELGCTARQRRLCRASSRLQRTRPSG